MKKIINGKTYNPDTATIVARWDNGRILEGFSYVQETLYKTRKGDLFLLGEGGAATIYSKTLSDGWTAYGWDIIPMTPEAAQEWAERRGVTLD